MRRLSRIFCLLSTLILTAGLSMSAFAELAVPIRDAEITRLANSYFPIDIVLEDGQYRLSQPQVLNESQGESEFSVQLAIAHMPIGRAVFRTVLALDGTTNELLAPDLRLERVIPEPYMTNSAEIAEQRIHRWLSANEGALRWPLPDHPLVKNSFFSLGKLHAVNGALILTFR